MISLQVSRFLKEFFQQRRTSVDWNLTAEERRSLRSTLSSEGWKIFSEKLKELEREGMEYLVAAEAEGEWRRRKGFVEGLTQASQLAVNLLTVAEEGGVVPWLENLTERQAQELLELAMGARQAKNPGRLLEQERAEAERVSEKALRQALESR